MEMGWVIEEAQQEGSITDLPGCGCVSLKYLFCKGDWGINPLAHATNS